MHAAPHAIRDLAPLMTPNAVAILGASPRVSALGTYVVRNLSNFGFKGPIYPIHPTAQLVEGHPCYASLADVPTTPDCVVVALAADKVLPALEDAAERGVRAAVVFASGFSELGAEGKALQARLVDLHERTGLIVCGPNCLGLINIHAQTSLYSAPPPDPLRAGGVAVVSHSGSGCIALAGVARFGISHLVSVGNGAILDIADYLEFFATDSNTRVAALFMESVRDPIRFAHAVTAMRNAGKPVVALRVGRSTKGAAATAAHTGSLAGSEEVYSEYFRSLGVILVDDIDELIESCVLMEAQMPAPAGDGVAVVNCSGGEIALTCDIGQSVGMRFAELLPETLAKIASALPTFATPSNPLDVTGAAVSDTSLYTTCLEALLQDPDVALLAVSQDCPVGIGAAGAANYNLIAAVTAQAAFAAKKPVAFYSNVGGGMHPTVIEPLLAAGVPAMQGAKPALSAIKHYLDWCQWTRPPVVADADVPINAIKWIARLQNGEKLSEREAKAFLADHGLPTTREQLASDADEAVAIATSLRFPVVMKIDSADIAHKTEMGGVRLGIDSEQSVRVAFDEILANARQHAPSARLNGVVVQEMVSGGVEMIVGMSMQRPFGPAIVVGSGGILVELVKDSALALAPVHPERATALVGATRASRLLKGYRGSAPADIRALEDLVVRLSAISVAYADQLDAIDLNPVSVLPNGKGVRILDAFVSPTAAQNQS